MPLHGGSRKQSWFPMKTKWKKKNGNYFETNDEQATIDYCESLGMTRIDSPTDAPEGDGSDADNELEPEAE